MKRALLSVSDKTGIVEFARGLEEAGYEVVSTGGTLKALLDAGVSAVNVSQITGYPECLDGRVKTLHPVVHAGILAIRSNPMHMETLEKLDVQPVDVVAVNLYPFKQTIMKENVSLQEAIENIDIGGPTMLRSAAKNYQDVYAVCDPADYQTVLEHIRSGEDDREFRLRLMYKVYRHTAVYDTLISNYLCERLGDKFPDDITFAYEKVQDMRYGENPNQKAAFYREVFPYPGAITAATQLQGKELSYNNINDTNGALDLLREFSEPCVVAVKHANPCGVGTGATVEEAYRKAYDSDPVSIFGGIVVTNCPISEELAREMAKTFLEIIVAPSFEEGALAVFREKRKNARLLQLPTVNTPIKAGTYDMKKVLGGLLVQEYDDVVFDETKWRVVTKCKPTPEQEEAMRFGFRVVKHVKSNAIVVSGKDSTYGVGMGQTNRIWAAQQALEHAGERAKGAVLASDAFFPFPDCVEAAAAAGVTAIIQPGGSVNDQMSIDACDRLGIAMVFCGMRHFKH